MRSVGIFWFLNLLASAPLEAALHRHACSVRLDCPVCGTENLHQRCEHDVSFVDAVTLDEVIALTLAAWDEAVGDRQQRLAGV